MKTYKIIQPKNRMENISKSLFLLIFLFAVSIFYSAKAQETERSNQIVKSFAVLENCQLTVVNKYGNVQINTWDKDSVRFEISYKAKAEKIQKLDAIYNMIDFKFNASKYFVVATTTFNSNQTNIIDDLNNMMKTLFAGSNSLEINYIVYCPRKANLRIENKFGNVSMNDIFGNLTILLKNGDLKVNNVNGFFSLNLDFGNANIKSVKDGYISCNFSEVELKSAANLEIVSRSSKINFEEIINLKISSQRDKLYVGKSSTITGSTSFSYVSIYNLSESLNLRTKFGEFNLTKAENGFSNMSFECDYTDVKIGLNKTAAYEIKVEKSESASVTLPSNANMISNQMIDPKKKITQLIARVGKENSTSKIFIKTNSGKVILTNN